MRPSISTLIWFHYRKQLIQDARKRAFEGSAWTAWAGVSGRATTSGITVDVNGEKIPALRGNRLSDGAPLTVYPGEVPREACPVRRSGMRVTV